MSSKHLLIPAVSDGSAWGIRPSNLGDTRPTFRGTWVVADPNAVTTGPAAKSSNSVVVQVDWTIDEDGMDQNHVEPRYEKIAARFYKLMPGARTPVKHMDVNLLELGE